MKTTILVRGRAMTAAIVTGALAVAAHSEDSARYGGDTWDFYGIDNVVGINGPHSGRDEQPLEFAEDIRERSEAPQADMEATAADGVSDEPVVRVNATVTELAGLGVLRDRSADGTFVVMHVRLDDGAEGVVSLGRVMVEPEGGLAAGDEIELEGRHETLDGEPVFLAQRIVAGGWTRNAHGVLPMRTSHDRFRGGETAAVD